MAVIYDTRLDGPGSNPGGDDIFRTSRPALGPTQPPVQWVPGLSRGYRQPGRGGDPPPLPVPKVLEKSRAIPLLTLSACVAYKKRAKPYLIYDTLPMIKFRTFVIIVIIIIIIINFTFSVSFS